MFDAELGVGEDPATGSAAGALGAYLAEHDLAGMPGSVLIRQGAQVGRPSELFVETGREDGAGASGSGEASTWSAGGRSSSERLAVAASLGAPVRVLSIRPGRSLTEP